MKAVELRPGTPRVVHHATMQVDPTPSSRIADARDPLPGYDEMFSRSMAAPPGGFFLGWTPGRTAAPFPEGMEHAKEKTEIRQEQKEQFQS